MFSFKQVKRFDYLKKSLDKIFFAFSKENFPQVLALSSHTVLFRGLIADEPRYQPQNQDREMHSW